MRTYMSTFGRRVLPLRDGFPSDATALAWSAESEARAILAETEPEDGNAASTWRRQTLYAPVWAVRCNTEGEALAEALAGFIGMEG